MGYIEVVLAKIPPDIRKNIVDNRMIERASEVPIKNSPMQYLFMIYNGFINTRGEYDNWNCPKCRMHILTEWRKLLPKLKEMQSISEL